MRSVICLLLLFCCLESYSQSGPQTFTYKAAGGQNLELDVYLPEQTGGLRPVVIFFHGGGWTGGNRSSMSRQCAYFAQRGMVAVTASYRLVKKGTSDYEKEFRNCIYDAKSAVRWVKANALKLGADTSKVVLGGGSAGGYLAVMAALDQGINDPADDLKISTRAKALVLFNPAFPKRSEVPLPFEGIRRNSPPAISFFGDGDSVWMPNGLVFEDLLKKAGVVSEFWIAAGQKHGFYNQQEWTDATLSKADVFISSMGMIEPLQLPEIKALLIRRTSSD